jgi:hypothetical protein
VRCNAEQFEKPHECTHSTHAFVSTALLAFDVVTSLVAADAADWRGRRL